MAQNELARGELADVCLQRCEEGRFGHGPHRTEINHLGINPRRAQAGCPLPHLVTLCGEVEDLPSCAFGAYGRSGKLS
jgi:hypothetical protein